MKELTQKQVEKGVAALDQLREGIIPESFLTPWAVFEFLHKKYPTMTHIKQVQMWDEKNHWLTFANYAVDEDGIILGLPCNDTRPCPPC